MATPSTATPKRPGLKTGVVTEFTIYTNVKPGHEQAVREAIERVRDHAGEPAEADEHG